MVLYLWLTIFISLMSDVKVSMADDDTSSISINKEEALKKKIVCYFTHESFGKGDFAPETIKPNMCTHINYCFANLNESTYEIYYGNEEVDVGQNFYKRITDLKIGNDKLKVLLSIGGWWDSIRPKYSEMAADANRRSHFISHAVNFLKQYNFDGLDIAWEYPNCRMGQCGMWPQDRENYITLLKELRAAFDPESLQLTASASSNVKEIDAAYIVPEMMKYLDHVNVMAYDWHCGSWENETNVHSQFFPRKRKESFPDLNVDASMKHWVKKKAVPSKLILGIPSYGRTFKLLKANDTKLHTKAVGPGDPMDFTKDIGYLAYSEICTGISKNGWTEVTNNMIGSFAVFNFTWVGYDSPRTAVLKARYVLRNGFGGVGNKYFYTDDYNGTCYGKPFPILYSLTYGLYSLPEKDFEAMDISTAAYIGRMNMAQIINNQAELVQNLEDQNSKLDDDDIVLHLKRTTTNDEGQRMFQEIDINAGTLKTTVKETML